MTNKNDGVSTEHELEALKAVIGKCVNWLDETNTDFIKERLSEALDGASYTVDGRGRWWLHNGFAIRPLTDGEAAFAAWGAEDALKGE
jgi:hypothetical protein